MGISHLHVVHKKHTREILESRASNCTNGLYVSPKMGDTVNSLQPLNISWDPTCMTNKDIDIYLISPNADYPRIHLWENVALSRASYNATLMPRWWNATASQSLQISILPAGQPPFLSTFPAGPIFTATYAQPSSGTPASADTNQIDSGVTAVNDGAKKKGMNPGKTFAAVFFTLVFVVLCIGAYIKLKRSKGLEKRKAWTEAIDKRMSTISTDWKSVSGAGANAAIRNSMAIGSRNSSSFSFGGIRPSSTFAVESDEAGRPMSQVRTGTGVGLRNPAALSSTERVSRVSFAADTRPSRVSVADSRPSGESRRTRAFHSAYIPPVPALPDTTNDDDDAEDNSGSFSPRQTQGALTLTPEDIRSRVTSPAKTTTTSKGAIQDKSDLSDFLPALSMMRTGSTTEPDDYLLPTPPPAMPTKPITQLTTSPVMATMPMQPMPANVMSPDEMLRAYAERKKSMNAATAALKGGGKRISAAAISYPVPAASAATPTSSASGGMRVLYDAKRVSGGGGAAGVAASSGDVYDTTSSYTAATTSEKRRTTYYAPSEYSRASRASSSTNPYAQYAFGQGAGASVGVGAFGGAQYAIGEDEDDVAVIGRKRLSNGYGGHNYAGVGRAT